MPKLLEFKNVSVEAGEHVAILGPNGSGKSTLLKTVTRECYPRYPLQSSMRIWGEEIWTLFELRATLGIVTNDLVATCTKPYSAMETVLSAFFGSIGIWPNHHVTSGMEQKAREVLEFFEVAHLAERLMTELSSGEARRVVFARALAHNPKALVLDEPSNSLDVRAQREVRDAMRKLAQNGVTTVIVVTHHLPDIIPEIERVVALKTGRIFFDGKKEKLLTAAKMEELFETPVQLEAGRGVYNMGLAD
jgi:iron complex transport system ATP-binding protein